MTTAKKPRKKPAPAAAATIVSSSNRPKLRIQNLVASIRFVIPGYNWQTVALAHAIAGQVLIEAGDMCWPWLLAPRVDPGDRLLTCTVVTLDLRLFGEGLTRSEQPELEGRMVVLSRHALDAARRVVKPLGAREPTHDVVVDVAKES